MIEPQRRTLGKHINEGARLLWEKLREKGWSQTRLARELPCSLGLAWRWLYCDQRPDGKRRALIEDKLGVPWRAWDELPTAEIVLPANENGARDSA